MRKTIITVCVIALSIISYCQNYSGSFVIMAQGKDGIMVASDTRVSLADTNKKQYAYFDGVPKFVTIGKNVLATVGVASIRGYFLGMLKKMFIQKNGTGVRVDSLLDKYEELLLSSEDPQVAGVIAYAIGFRKGEPFFCVKKLNVLKQCSDGGVRASGEIYNLNEYNESLTCDSLAKIAERTIRRYAKDNKKETVIGGPIAAIKLTKSGVIWLKGKPSAEYLTNDDVIRAYLDKKLIMHFVGSDGKQKFDRVIADYNQQNR